MTWRGAGSRRGAWAAALWGTAWVMPASAQDAPIETTALPPVPAVVVAEPAAGDEPAGDASATGAGVEAKTQMVEVDSEDAPASARSSVKQATLFMERTHFGLRVDGMRDARPEAANRNIVFEGSPALHLFLFNHLNEYTQKMASARRWYDHLAFSLTFNPEVRMLSVASEPVRAPSWRVRANVQWFLQANYLASLYAAQLTGLRLSFGHYSNGQESCSFQRGVSIADDPSCERYPGTQDVSLVNRDNGDFSLNHLTVAAHHRWVHLRAAQYGKLGSPGLEEHRSHTVGLTADVFVDDWMMGGMSAALGRLYGDYRVRAEYRYERTFDSWIWPTWRGANRLALEGYYEITFDASRVTQQRAGVEAALTAPSANDIGMFVSVFRGNDYYNLLFVDVVEYQVLVGIVGELYGRPQYRDPTLAPSPAHR